MPSSTLVIPYQPALSAVQRIDSLYSTRPVQTPGGSAFIGTTAKTVPTKLCHALGEYFTVSPGLIRKSGQTLVVCVCETAKYRRLVYVCKTP